MRWLCIALICTPAFAAEVLSNADASMLLKRFAGAAKQLDYEGVYLYQRGGVIDSYQIVHIKDQKGEGEKRESLDGPPKLMLRENDHITMYLPDAKKLDLDKSAVNKLFPGLIPDNPQALLDVYYFVRQPNERVAGIDANAVVMEPKDQFRYSYKLWYDNKTGLLLKAAMFHPQRGILEQFTFTQLQIDEKLDRKDLKPSLSDKDFEKYASLNSPIDPPPQHNLEIKGLPAGFKVVKQSSRRMHGKSEPVSHWLISDGLSTVSIFAEPLSANQKPREGMSSKDGVSMGSKGIANLQITVMGEVPDTLVQQIINSVIPK